MTNFRSLATAVLLGVSAFAIVAPASAAPACRDASGHFIKCTDAAATKAPHKMAKPAAPKRTAAKMAPKSTKNTHAMAAAKPVASASKKTSTAAHPAG